MENNVTLKEPMDEILNCIKDSSKERLIKILSTSHPADTAEIFYEIDEEQLDFCLKCLDLEIMSKIFEFSDEELQIRILNLINTEQILSVLSKMQPDDVADFLGELNISRRKELLRRMKDEQSEQISALLAYSPDTAGGIMTTRYIALHSYNTVKQALSKIKQISPKTEIIEVLFVVNRANKLIGSTHIRDILVADEDTKISEITNETVVSVFVDVDKEEVSLIFSKYGLFAIPVVSRKGAILGIITADDIIDVIIEEQTEDILAMGGVSKEETATSSIVTSIKMRLPWLFINLFTAFLASWTVSLFQGTIEKVVALAAVMPIVAGMGGNTGTQTLSVTIRNIALGEISLKEDWKLVIKESSLGLINGAAIGVLTGIVIYVQYKNFTLSLIIFAAMIINMVIAGFFGFLLPMVLKTLKVDPALASSIFLTTATDVLGFFAFLGLAQMFLPYLL